MREKDKLTLVFNRKLLGIIGPPKKWTHNVRDIVGVTQSIPGFLDPGGSANYAKSPKILDIKTKLGSVGYSNKFYKMGYYVHPLRHLCRHYDVIIEDNRSFGLKFLSKLIFKFF